MTTDGECDRCRQVWVNLLPIADWMRSKAMADRERVAGMPRAVLTALAGAQWPETAAWERWCAASQPDAETRRARLRWDCMTGWTYGRPPMGMPTKALPSPTAAATGGGVVTDIVDRPRDACR